MQSLFTIAFVAVAILAFAQTPQPAKPLDVKSELDELKRARDETKRALAALQAEASKSKNALDTLTKGVTPAAEFELKQRTLRVAIVAAVTVALSFLGTMIWNVVNAGILRQIALSTKAVDIAVTCSKAYYEILEARSAGMQQIEAKYQSRAELERTVENASKDFATKKQALKEANRLLEQRRAEFSAARTASDGQAIQNAEEELAGVERVATMAKGEAADAKRVLDQCQLACEPHRKEEKRVKWNFYTRLWGLHYLQFFLYRQGALDRDLYRVWLFAAVDRFRKNRDELKLSNDALVKHIDDPVFREECFKLMGSVSVDLMTDSEAAKRTNPLWRILDNRLDANRRAGIGDFKYRLLLAVFFALITSGISAGITYIMEGDGTTVGYLVCAFVTIAVVWLFGWPYAARALEKSSG
jgi:hypothetical protein